MRHGENTINAFERKHRLMKAAQWYGSEKMAKPLSKWRGMAALASGVEMA
jgi:hypothetical protein